MSEKNQASLQERFIAALKEKLKNFYSVEKFAESVKLKPSLIQEILKGKRVPDHAAMQTIAGGMGYDSMAFLDYGQEVLDRQAEMEKRFAPPPAEKKPAVPPPAAPKPKALAKKNALGASVVPKPVEEIIEDFGAWARGMVRRDPKMAVWLEKQLEIWMTMTDPNLGKAKAVADKPKDVI